MWGFEDPWDLESTFWIPTASKTVLTAPPAITPVPGVAGLIKTLEPPYFPFCSWGSVPFSIGILTKFFLASSTAFEIAVVTSFAFPKPWPTTPFSSPTITIAEKPNALPPFVTLVTLCIPTSLSLRSKPTGLTSSIFL